MKKRSSVSGRLVVGNWKCRKSPAEANDWLAEFNEGYEPVEGVSVVIAVPMTLLVPLSDQLKSIDKRCFFLAAQDVSAFPSGNYTGATSADMLTGICSHVIVGHPERRRYFHETVRDVVNKVSEAADSGLVPIVCVDDKNAMSQLTALSNIDCNSLVIAFNAADDTDFHEPPPVETVARLASYVSQVYPLRPVIYGGRVSRSNYRALLAVPHISGFMVGEDSLQPRSFLSIVKAVQQSSPAMT